VRQARLATLWRPDITKQEAGRVAAGTVSLFHSRNPVESGPPYLNRPGSGGAQLKVQSRRPRLRRPVQCGLSRVTFEHLAQLRTFGRRMHKRFPVHCFDLSA